MRELLDGLDLFSGVGLLTVALAPWVRPVAYCEIDEYACSVLMSRMADGRLPVAPIWDDVATLRAEHLAGRRPRIITGGFPCQDLSVAGSRRGLEGERSGLYREFIRLVGEVRPLFVFMENVAGIRKHAHVVVGDLAALGYDCRWTTLSAAEVGAPHKRERWWLLARLVADADGESVRLIAEREQLDASERWHAEPSEPRRGSDAVADADSGRLPSLGPGNDEDGGDATGRVADGPFALPHWDWATAPFPAIRRVDDGHLARVDRLRCLGNGVVPKCAREAFAYLAGLERWRLR